jgi:hypothetical protein
VSAKIQKSGELSVTLPVVLISLQQICTIGCKKRNRNEDKKHF